MMNKPQRNQVNFDIICKDEIVIIKLKTDFTDDAGYEAGECIEKLIKSGYRWFIFDFKECQWIGSSGIRCIMEADL